jgi:hypothetical protein
MCNPKVCLVFVFITLFSTTHLLSQSDSTKAKKELSYFKASLGFLSNSIYNGRKDSLATPYITPTIGYYHKSGLYANASMSYLASSNESRVDLYTLEAGYEFNVTSQFTGSVYASKEFYNSSSTNIQSAIKGYAGTSLSYDFNFIQLNAGADLLFADKTDVSINTSISHEFSIGESDWTITPAALLNMSTLNFYEGYTNRRVGKNTKKNIPAGATVAATTTITNRGTGLTLLDYEFSAPVSYDAKTWGFTFTPTIALPQNPIYTSTGYTVYSKNGVLLSTIPPKESTPESEKTLGTVFYAELSVYFKF